MLGVADVLMGKSKARGTLPYNLRKAADGLRNERLKMQRMQTF